MSESAATNEAMTVGMRLDAFLDALSTRMDAVTSTHVYLFTVAVMIIGSFLLLSTGQLDQPETKNIAIARVEKVSVAPVKKASDKPAWYAYVRFMNFTLLACFLASLVAFFQRASIFNSETPILYKFLIGWSIYLGYFFSFSGVSLLYDSLEEVDQQARYVHSLCPSTGKPRMLPFCLQRTHDPHCSPASVTMFNSPWNDRPWHHERLCCPRHYRLQCAAIQPRLQNHPK
jgi:hypothetical protein